MLISDLTTPYADTYLERVRTPGLERLLAACQAALAVAEAGERDGWPRAATIRDAARDKIAALQYELTRRGIVYELADARLDQQAAAAARKRRKHATKPAA